MTTPASLPTVPRMLVALGVGAVGIAVCSWALVWLVAVHALPLAPDEQRRVLVLCVGMAPVHVVALTAAAALRLRGASTLRRFLGRSAGRWGEAPVPDALLRSVFDAPVDVVLFALVVVIGLLVLDATGLVDLSGLPLWPRLAVDVLAAGIVQGGLHLTALQQRRHLWDWLRVIDPGAVSLPATSRIWRRFALRLVSSSLLVVAGGASVLLAHVPAHREDALEVALAAFGTAVGVGLLVSLAAVAWARRLGGALGEDAENLGHYVEELSRDDEWALDDDVPRLAVPVKTEVAAELALRVRSLAERYARLAVQEGQARRAVEGAQAARTRFTAFMSHDLRSPLNSIKGFAQVLARGNDGPLSAEQRESVMSILESSDELLLLVNDIVDWTRLDAGRMSVRTEPMTPLELVDGVLESLDELAGPRRSRLEVDVSDALPEVEADEERGPQLLFLVVVHLLRVAPGGPVHLRAVRADDGGEVVRFELWSEDAPPEPEPAQLFAGMRPAISQAGQRVPGLGLGLAVARRLAELLGGHLAYDTQTSRFVATLRVTGG